MLKMIGTRCCILYIFRMPGYILNFTEISLNNLITVNFRILVHGVKFDINYAFYFEY